MVIFMTKFTHHNLLLLTYSMKYILSIVIEFISLAQVVPNLIQGVAFRLKDMGLGMVCVCVCERVSE